MPEPEPIAYRRRPPVLPELQAGAASAAAKSSGEILFMGLLYYGAVVLGLDPQVDGRLEGVEVRLAAGELERVVRRLRRVRRDEEAALIRVVEVDARADLVADVLQRRVVGRADAGEVHRATSRSRSPPAWHDAQFVSAGRIALVLNDAS